MRDNQLGLDSCVLDFNLADGLALLWSQVHTAAPIVADSQIEPLITKARRIAHCTCRCGIPMLLWCVGETSYCLK